MKTSAFGGCPTLVATTTAAGGILTLIVQQLFTARTLARRAREHRMQTLADTALAKQETEGLATELAIEVQARVDLIRHAIEENCRHCQLASKQVSSQLAEHAVLPKENTVLTEEVKQEAHAAYAEAKTVNQKLETSGVQIRDGTAPPFPRAVGVRRAMVGAAHRDMADRTVGALRAKCADALAGTGGPDSRVDCRIRFQRSDPGGLRRRDCGRPRPSPEPVAAGRDQDTLPAAKCRVFLEEPDTSFANRINRLGKKCRKWQVFLG
jgi:hypothetical protein